MNEVSVAKFRKGTTLLGYSIFDETWYSVEQFHEGACKYEEIAKFQSEAMRDYYFAMLDAGRFAGVVTHRVEYRLDDAAMRVKEITA